MPWTPVRPESPRYQVSRDAELLSTSRQQEDRMKEQTTQDGSRPADGSSPAIERRLLEGETLAEVIRTELRSDPTTAALAIDVEVWDRVVHLRGVAAAPDEKAAAERTATRAARGALVANDMELRRAPISERPASERHVP
jgi:hypothetical protein